tara:strand:+ start:619 stop:1014 length:396 start_codon:yes stop_codon:yes gene_type:complete
MNWSPAQIGALENCGVKVEDATGDISFREYEFIDIIKPEPLRPTKGLVKLESVEEATRLPNYNKVGNIIDCYLAWRGTNYMIKMFFPSVKKPSRREVQDQLHKVYPGSKLWNYQVSSHEPGEPILQTTGGS